FWDKRGIQVYLQAPGLQCLERSCKHEVRRLPVGLPGNLRLCRGELVVAPYLNQPGWRLLKHGQNGIERAAESIRADALRLARGINAIPDAAAEAGGTGKRGISGCRRVQQVLLKMQRQVRAVQHRRAVGRV